jgi:hypothetical protein
VSTPWSRNTPRSPTSAASSSCSAPLTYSTESAAASSRRSYAAIAAVSTSANAECLSERLNTSALRRIGSTTSHAVGGVTSTAGSVSRSQRRTAPTCTRTSAVASRRPSADPYTGSTNGEYT